MGRGQSEVMDVTVGGEVFKRGRRSRRPDLLVAPVKLSATDATVLGALHHERTISPDGWGTTVRRLAVQIYGKKASDADRRRVQTSLRSLRKRELVESKDISCPYLFWRPVAGAGAVATTQDN